MVFRSVIWCSLVASALTSPTPSKGRNDFNWHNIESLIAFGDSYTYVQGVLGHPNYTYIGDNFKLSFTPAELFSNRIVQNQTSTASGGPVWTQSLTGCGDQPGLTDPKKCDVQLWDFAYAGANTNEELTPLHWNHTVSLEKQILQFEHYGDPALQTVLTRENALVAIWIGINDINDLVKLQGKNATFAPMYEQLQRQQFKLVERVYSLGYRNFLFLNLPPLDRGPSPSVNATLVSTYNSILAAHATEFQECHDDANILQFDVNTALNEIFDDAATYGFTNTTGWCPGYNQPDITTDPAKYGCGEGLDTYLWYNSGHLTSRVHDVFTEVLREWLVAKST